MKQPRFLMLAGLVALLLTSCMEQEYVSPMVIEEQEVQDDALHLRASRIRVSMMDADTRSLFRVEALRKGKVVMSVEYNAQMDAGKERMVVLARGLKEDGTETSGAIVVLDGKEVTDELSHNRRLTAGLIWLLGPEGEVRRNHRLVGGAGSFTAGTGMWVTQFSHGQCVPCRAGHWCNCD